MCTDERVTLTKQSPRLWGLGGSVWGRWLTVQSQQASLQMSNVHWPSRGSPVPPPPVLQVCARSRSAATHSVIASSYAPVVRPESLERVSGALWDGVG